MGMFRVCDNKGFQIEFDNGYIVSCQFGTFNYCSRRSFDSKDFFKERKMSIVESPDCEIAIIDGKDKCRGVGGFVTGEIFEKMGLGILFEDMVAGYVSADDVGKIIAYVKDLEG